MIPLFGSSQLSFITSRIISTKPGKAESGTAFFFDFTDDGRFRLPCLATNWHVVEDSSAVQIVINSRADRDAPIIGAYSTINWSYTTFPWIRHPDPDIDLAIAPMAPVIDLAQVEKLRIFFKKAVPSLIPRSEEWRNFGLVENVLSVGYPEGLWDSVNNMPIVRKGITATHVGLDYEGAPEFLVDIPCFPGASGSPVFIHDDLHYLEYSDEAVTRKQGQRTRLAGIVRAGLTRRPPENPTGIGPSTAEMQFMNLAVCIRADKLLDFLPIIQKLDPPPYE